LEVEVEMLKKCTLLRHEAHFEAKMLKQPSVGLLLEVAFLKKCTPDGLGPLLDVEMSKKCTLLWREAQSQKC